MAVLAQISFIPEIMYANLSARSQRQGLLGSIAMAEPEDHGPGPPIPGPRVSDHTPHLLSSVKAYFKIVGGIFIVLSSRSVFPEWKKVHDKYYIWLQLTLLA